MGDEEKLKLDIELYEKDDEKKNDRINTDEFSLDDLKKHIGYARKFKYCLHFSKFFISKSLNFWQIQLKLFRIQTYPNNLVMNLDNKTSKLFLDSDDEEEEENVKEFIKSENNFLDDESEESDESQSEEEIKPKKKTRGRVKS